MAQGLHFVTTVCHRAFRYYSSPSDDGCGVATAIPCPLKIGEMSIEIGDKCGQLMVVL